MSTLVKDQKSSFSSRWRETFIVMTKFMRITTWKGVVFLLLLGFCVYSVGLSNPFQGDDFSQIVDSVPVHSLTHLPVLFEGSTFYEGHGAGSLSGTYYRPLMTVTFALLYSLFGLHTFFYHLLQLILFTATSILIFLFFKNIFKPRAALFCAAIFLVHPINSQVVYAIPSMQDVLYLFFGMLALYLLARYSGNRILPVVAFSLFMSLLSKESAILFIAMSVLYIFFANRERLIRFLVYMILPVAVFSILRVHAVGIFTNPHAGPIDALSLSTRLLNIPEIILFYLSKSIFPLRLASAYYWSQTMFSVRYVLLPLILEVMVVALIVMFALRLKHSENKSDFYTFIYFSVWTTLGLIMLVQIIPLDMTVSVSWFCFPMIGFMGMLSIMAKTLYNKTNWRINSYALHGVSFALIAIFAVISSIHGLNFRSQNRLSEANISYGSDDFTAYNILAESYMSQGKLDLAKTYARHSIAISPSFANYNTLGEITGREGDFAQAVRAYTSAIAYGGNYAVMYENLSQLKIVYGNLSNNQQFIVSSINKFPQDPVLWMDLAIFEQKYGNNLIAKEAINRAIVYGQIPQTLYDAIINNQTLAIHLTGLNATITI
jgi:hypothetical protein